MFVTLVKRVVSNGEKQCVEFGKNDAHKAIIHHASLTHYTSPMQDHTMGGSGSKKKKEAEQKPEKVGCFITPVEPDGTFLSFFLFFSELHPHTYTPC